MHKKGTAWFAGGFLLVVIMLFAFLKSGENQTPDQSVTLENGRMLYKANCASCHGLNGEGRLVGNATSLNNKEFLSIVSDDFLLSTIAEGRLGTQMPAFDQAYGGSLTKEEIDDIISFLRQWKSEIPDMPVPTNIAGDPGLGRKLYAANCATCHGITAQGELNMGPSLVNPDFLEVASDEFIWVTTALGRSKTPMGPSLKGLGGVRELSKQQISSIITYLRNVGKESEKTRSE